LLIVFFVFEALASLRMIFLIGPTADHTIELDVRSVKLGLTWLQNRIEARNQSGNLIAIEISVVIIQVVEISLLVVLGLVVTAFDSPNVSPMRGRGVVCAKEVVRTRQPLVEIFLNKPCGNDARLHDSP